MTLRTTTPRQAQRGISRGASLTLIVLVVLVAGAWWWWTKSRQAGEGAAPAAASAASSGARGPGGPAGPGGPGGPGGRRFGGAQGPQPVSTAKVRRQDIKVTSTAIGSIAASNTAVVRAQVTGVLQKILFKEGQQVKAGEVLAVIDPRSFQAALALAQGTLARDQALLENARLDLTRYQDLVAKDAAPKQQADTQRSLVRQYEGTVKSDQANVDSAKLQLSYTTVTAPISGRVGLKQVDLGNIVTSGDTNGIVTIAQTRPIALIFSVPSAQLPQIVTSLKANQPLPVEAVDRSGASRLATGKVETVDNAIDVTTDTIKVKALFPNEDDALFPNQAVGVRLQLSTLHDVLTVPQAAVLRGAQGFYVYVVNEDKSVTTRPVKTGAVDGTWMAVEGQLQEGEEVVIDGVDRLREGAKVEVIAADPQQRAGASAPAGGNRRGPRNRGAASAPGGSASAPMGGASRAPMDGGPAALASPADAASRPHGQWRRDGMDNGAPPSDGASRPRRQRPEEGGAFPPPDGASRPRRGQNDANDGRPAPAGQRP